MHTFYVDDLVSSFINHCSNHRNPVEGVQVSASSKMLLLSYVDENKERKTYTFNLEEDTFNIHSNGHHLGKFSYEDEKIVAKWPKKLTKREILSMIGEIQEFFRRVD